MSKKELKTKVDEYFEKYMCVSFDKFLENFNELEEWYRYKEKEIERLNNIIEEFEIYLLNLISNREQEKATLGQCIVYKTLSLTLEKLQELKGEN